MAIPEEDEAPDARAERLRRSWTANADAWRDAVRENQIESRQVATNAAVVEAVLDAAPTRVLDVGCGEGWLCRALAEHGVDTVGVDGAAPLIEAARERGSGAFYTYSYAEVAEEPSRLGGTYDVVVCNFSLLEEDLQPLLAALHVCCAPTGRLVVQTVHPWAARGGQAYADGWRTEDFRDVDEAFEAPMPWYFRTLESWSGTLTEADWHLHSIREPRHPDTGDPLSLLLTAMPGPA